MPTEIVRSQTPEEEELAKKLAELDALQAELAERELDLATLLGELHLFERRYLREVGVKYAELDELRARIAELQAERAPQDPKAQEEAAQARARAEESARTAESAEEPGKPESFEPSPSLKKLYREVAKKIHPDLADGEKERARRTGLMAEANRAYEEGDEARLQAILREWDSSPEAVAGDGTGAELVRVIRKIAQVQARLDAIRTELSAVKDSTLWTLKSKVEEAEAEGHHLLVEMAAAVDREIKKARDEVSRISGES